MTRLTALAFAATLSTTVAAQQIIDVEDAPASALAVAEETAPGAEFDDVSVEVEAGVTVYEFRGVDYAGRRIEVDVTEDGALEEIEMEEAAADLPAVVLEAIEAREPGFEVTKVETSVRANGDFAYEVEGLDGRGDFVEFDVTEDGEIIGEDDIASS